MDVFSYLLVAVVFLLMISVLVAAHELGHFLFARLFKMDVEEFAIGFGKPKWVWLKRNNTEYTFRAWPLGGFVRIKGMAPAEDGSEVHIQNGFYSKPPWQRLVVLAAGPVFSIVFGIMILTPLLMSQGKTVFGNEPVVAAVTPEGPAAMAGIQEGDRITSVNGKPVNTAYEVIERVRFAGPEPITLQLLREGKPLTVVSTPVLDSEPMPVLDAEQRPIGPARKQYRLMMLLQMEQKPLAFGAAAQEAALLPVLIVQRLAVLAQNPQTARQEVGGPITIVAATNNATRSGIGGVLFLSGILSISLGIMNLLPIPPLDGGQMTVAIAEMLNRGKRLSFKLQNAISAVGLVMVALLIVSVLLVDVSRFFVLAR
jgi:regulator of sigma E protease